MADRRTRKRPAEGMSATPRGRRGLSRVGQRHAAALAARSDAFLTPLLHRGSGTLAYSFAPPSPFTRAGFAPPASLRQAEALWHDLAQRYTGASALQRSHLKGSLLADHQLLVLLAGLTTTGTHAHWPSWEGDEHNAPAASSVGAHASPMPGTLAPRQRNAISRAAIRAGSDSIALPILARASMSMSRGAGPFTSSAHPIPRPDPVRDLIVQRSTTRDRWHQRFGHGAPMLVALAEALPRDVDDAIAPASGSDGAAPVVMRNAPTFIPSFTRLPALYDLAVSLQRKPRPGVTDPPLERRVDAMSLASGSSGAPLDAGVRQVMEQTLGHHFDDVRVHVDGAAAGAASMIAAQAFTVQRHIFFAPGRYQPRTLEGAMLLAHELTHTTQQQTVPARKALPGSTAGSTDFEPRSLEAPALYAESQILQAFSGPQSLQRALAVAEAVPSASPWVLPGAIGADAILLPSARPSFMPVAARLASSESRHDPADHPPLSRGAPATFIPLSDRHGQSTSLATPEALQGGAARGSSISNFEGAGGSPGIRHAEVQSAPLLVSAPANSPDLTRPHSAITRPHSPSTTVLSRRTFAAVSAAASALSAMRRSRDQAMVATTGHRTSATSQPLTPTTDHSLRGMAARSLDTSGGTPAHTFITQSAPVAGAQALQRTPIRQSGGSRGTNAALAAHPAGIAAYSALSRVLQRAASGLQTSIFAGNNVALEPLPGPSSPVRPVPAPAAERFAEPRSVYGTPGHPAPFDSTGESSSALWQAYESGVSGIVPGHTSGYTDGSPLSRSVAGGRFMAPGTAAFPVLSRVLQRAVTGMHIPALAGSNLALEPVSSQIPPVRPMPAQRYEQSMETRLGSEASDLPAASVSPGPSASALWQAYARTAGGLVPGQASGRTGGALAGAMQRFALPARSSTTTARDSQLVPSRVEGDGRTSTRWPDTAMPVSTFGGAVIRARPSGLNSYPVATGAMSGVPPRLAAISGVGQPRALVGGLGLGAAPISRLALGQSLSDGPTTESPRRGTGLSSGQILPGFASQAGALGARLPLSEPSSQGLGESPVEPEARRVSQGHVSAGWSYLPAFTPGILSRQWQQPLLSNAYDVAKPANEAVRPMRLAGARAFMPEVVASRSESMAATLVPGTPSLGMQRMAVPATQTASIAPAATSWLAGTGGDASASPAFSSRQTASSSVWLAGSPGGARIGVDLSTNPMVRAAAGLLSSVQRASNARQSAVSTTHSDLSWPAPPAAHRPFSPLSVAAGGQSTSFMTAGVGGSVQLQRRALPDQSASSTMGNSLSRPATYVSALQSLAGQPMMTPAMAPAGGAVSGGLAGITRGLSPQRSHAASGSALYAPTIRGMAVVSGTSTASVQSGADGRPAIAGMTPFSSVSNAHTDASIFAPGLPFGAGSEAGMAAPSTTRANWSRAYSHLNAVQRRTSGLPLLAALPSAAMSGVPRAFSLMSLPSIGFEAEGRHAEGSSATPESAAGFTRSLQRWSIPRVAGSPLALPRTLEVTGQSAVTNGAGSTRGDLAAALTQAHYPRSIQRSGTAPTIAHLNLSAGTDVAGVGPVDPILPGMARAHHVGTLPLPDFSAMVGQRAFSIGSAQGSHEPLAPLPAAVEQRALAMPVMRHTISAPGATLPLTGGALYRLPRATGQSSVPAEVTGDAATRAFGDTAAVTSAGIMGIAGSLLQGGASPSRAGSGTGLGDTLLSRGAAPGETSPALQRRVLDAPMTQRSSTVLARPPWTDMPLQTSQAATAALAGGNLTVAVPPVQRHTPEPISSIQRRVPGAGTSVNEASQEHEAAAAAPAAPDLDQLEEKLFRRLKRQLILDFERSGDFLPDLLR